MTQLASLDNCLDALALAEATAAGDTEGQAAIVGATLHDPAGLIGGLIMVLLSLCNVGVAEGIWPNAGHALKLARIGVIDAYGHGGDEEQHD